MGTRRTIAPISLEATLSTGYQTWRAEGLSATLRASNWSEQLGAILLPLNVKSLSPIEYEAELTKSRLGSVELSLIRATTQVVELTRQAAAKAVEQKMFLVHLRAGRLRFRQQGREALLKSGDSVVMDGATPYEFTCPQSSTALVVHLQRPWLQRWFAAPEETVARRLSSEAGWARALSATLSMLDPRTTDALSVSGDLVAEQIATLLSLSVGIHRGAPEGGHSHARRRTRTRQAVIVRMRERLHEIHLCPRAMAEDFGFSLRYLHLLFAEAGTTFVTELYNQRLQHAEELLCAQDRQRRTVAEIAVCCGFQDASHFARRFRQRTGQTPRDFRRR